jgi:anti-sigma regulatory factor (Ser/Thr protein kinase)
MKVLMTIVLPAKLENLEGWVKSVSDCAASQGFAPKKIREIELATEEALVNICNYAYPERTGDVEVMCKLDSNRFIVEIIDSGIPFDITSLPDPDVTADADQRKIGGLGAFLIKKMVDEVKYRRENNRNILNLIIKKVKDT